MTKRKRKGEEGALAFFTFLSLKRPKSRERVIVAPKFKRMRQYQAFFNAILINVG